MVLQKKANAFLTSKKGTALGVVICSVFFAFVVVCGMSVAKCGIKESAVIGSSIVSMVSRNGIHKEQKPLDEVVAPANLQDAVTSGHKVIGGDSKKALVNVDGRVFAYDRASGTLLN